MNSDEYEAVVAAHLALLCRVQTELQVPAMALIGDLVHMTQSLRDTGRPDAATLLEALVEQVGPALLAGERGSTPRAQ